MKKFIILIILASIMFASCDLEMPPPTAIQEGQAAKDENLDTVLRSVPIPIV